ncbi:MAG: hypothetical protein IK008_01635 [Bacteroidales bacterium]|nr:hypothetical protein [Bacteroidales bacterium]
MIRDNKMPYEAPAMVSVILEAGNTLCQGSTGESFNSTVVYLTDGWEEED